MIDLATRAGLDNLESLAPELAKYTELVIAECAYRMEFEFDERWPARPTWKLYDHWHLQRPAWTSDRYWKPVTPHIPASQE
jgi:hypothetical protein